MRIELRYKDQILGGVAANLFLRFTSPWYLASRDSDGMRTQTQVSKISLREAESKVPRAFPRFREWVITRRIDNAHISYNQTQFEAARSFLTFAFLSGEDVKVHYIK